MRRNYIVYKVKLVDIDNTYRYISMPYTWYKKHYITTDDHRIREVIKKNLTKKKALNFANILNKLSDE